jgi:hypothetical protein
MAPILLKSVGPPSLKLRRDKPQYPVRKSTRFRCRDVAAVLAMLADDETA